MTENQRKLLLYLQPTVTYWKSTKGLKSVVDKYKIGFYPLSIKPRIDQGHYPYFDEEGIPCFPNFKGILVHHYTTICSYALGQWENHLLTGDNSHISIIIKIADYLLKSAVVDGEAYLFLDFDDDTEQTGSPCAMNQGEAISVLVRANVLTGDNKYLDAAFKAAKAYEKTYGLGGIAKELNGVGTWYQEGGKFILNGHNYAVWGLMELAEYTGDATVQKLYDQGIKSIEKALPKFDTGYWSWYWLNEPKHIASMMYHNLHIVQLGYLAEKTGSEPIKNYVKKFTAYAANPINRLRAALAFVREKF